MRPTPRLAEERPPATDGPATPVRHITATLFLGSEDAQHLTPVQREVPFGEGSVEQGRQIVLAQIEAQAEGAQLRVVPTGATLRGFYINDTGAAFVDLGPEIVAAHPGGTTAEQLTVYAIVNAVTANLPTIQRVQILIEGREADTLAGHVDLRRPLQQDLSIVREP
jgi:hypothetical protein